MYKFVMDNIPKTVPFMAAWRKGPLERPKCIPIAGFIISLGKSRLVNLKFSKIEVALKYKRMMLKNTNNLCIFCSSLIKSFAIIKAVKETMYVLNKKE